MDSASLCVACKLPVPEGASKCVKCGSFQNAWRFLPFGQTSLALVIALASVMGLVGERLYILVAGDYSDIRIATVASSQLGVTMLASNSGTRAGVISSAELELVGSWGNAIFDMDVTKRAAFIEPGEDILVEFTLTDKRPLPELLNGYLDTISASKKDAEVYDCVIIVKHILYEDTQDLAPMNRSYVSVPGAKTSPRSSFLTRSLFCWELGLQMTGLSLSPANETADE